MKKPPKHTGRSCPVCRVGELLERKGRFGLFVGCSKYPRCSYVEKQTATSKTPEEQAADDFLRRNGCDNLIMKW